ncbi:MAG TPA: tetratricopeptide repeat protein [Thermoplasmata archaeon]|nr:tetratricopeptide repeat protein [Thermoplasmata archaeon]
MAASGGTARPAPPASGAVEAARRLYRQAEERETHHDKTRYIEALKAFLAHVDANRRGLADEAAEVAARLDSAAMSFYRLSQPELARRAADLGLELAPGSATLLHHKALILVALNASNDEALALLDRADQAKPNDKAIWATRGDVLRLMDRGADAAAAYLRAQELDSTTMRYVERALKVAPHDRAALELKLKLARAHGNDRAALDAIGELRKAEPSDRALAITEVELLANLGEPNGALEAADRLGPDSESDDRLALIRGRLYIATGDVEKASRSYARVFRAGARPDANTVREVAERLEAAKAAPELALEARERLRGLEPRNLANLASLRALAEQLGRRDVAIEACRSILAASPDNLEAMRGIAELLVASGRSEEGFEAFRAVLRSHPKDAATFRKALETALTGSRRDLVVEFARAVIAADPDDLPARERLMEALAVGGSLGEAVAVVDELLARRPDHVGYWLEKRRLLTELGRSAELPVVYDQLFRLDPTRHDVAIERGNVHLAQAFEHPEGSLEREDAARAALVAYERASTDPNLGIASQLGIARASRLVHDADRAIAAYQAVLDAVGSGPHEELLKELGHAFREVGRASEAEAVYARAIEQGSEDPDLLWGEVQVLSQLDQDARALHYLEALLAHEPQAPMFLRRKGQLLLKLGRRDEGLQTLKGAVSGAGSDPHAYFEVGEALRAQGAFEDAVTYFQQGLTVDTKSRPGRLALAETLQLAGRYNEVIPHVDLLLREDPNDIGAWRARADAYRALHRPAEVEYSLRAILLLDPHNGPALLEKFRVHETAGDLPAALDALTQLLNAGGAESQDAALWVAHGDLAARLGTSDEAARSYERATALDPTQASEIAARRARARLAAGRPDLALEAIESAVGKATAKEQSVATLTLRAEILTALERPEEAKAVYEEIRRREPGSATAVAGITRSLLDQGQHAVAKEFLRTSLPTVRAEPPLFLLLAEAESGLGQIPEGVRALQQGVAALPKSVELWTRLGELLIATERWAEASDAFGHAIALDAGRPELQMRAGFVAEKLGHPNESLALYDRATELAPADKHAWVGRGLVLLGLGRSDEARQSFERALALDSDFEPAKEGKKASLQRAREGLIDRYGREALLLEARLHRPVTKNDLFVTLHVPYDLLEPVLHALSRPPKLDLAKLSESEMAELESASCLLITTALERRPEGIERRGFTLADVALLSPPANSLSAIQRLFSYLKAVLEVDLRPENLKLAPDVEELARRALTLPEGQRTLFQIVRTQKVGLYKARLVKAVETAGSAVHAPLPALNLGEYSPEFRDGGSASEAPGDERQYFSPENVPEDRVEPAATAVAVASVEPAEAGARCVGCGGIASVRHACGATLCHVCVAQFSTCPKCRLPVSAASQTPIAPPARPAHATHPPTVHPSSAHAKSTPRHAPDPPKSVAPKPHPPAPPHPVPEASEPAAPAEPPAAEPAPPPKTVRPPTPSRADEEPRL